MTLLLLFLIAIAQAASLPGIPLPFDTDAKGRWVVGANLSQSFSEAGVQPGWVLVAVDGQPFSDPVAAQRMVAAGPARDIQLSLGTGKEDVLLLVRRAPLVHVQEVGVLPYPEGFNAPATGWQEGGAGRPWLVDTKGGRWALDPSTAAQAPIPQESRGHGELGIPELWWALSDAGWVMEKSSGVSAGDANWARERLQGATRLRGFQGQSGDHLVVPGPDGLLVYAVGWPRGTRELPGCLPDVPESCLVAGRQIRAELLDRPGGRSEALRMLGIACEGGVHRACLEAISLEQPDLAARADTCLGSDVNACHELGKERLRTEPEPITDLTVGLLEFACEVDASGSLGQRLRRLEDVGEGCMMLSSAYDRLAIPDRALLSLDQACVLGRAEACTEAERRRQEAFALRTVRECEDPNLPLASACVQLGLLLQERTVSATKLDDFAAFQRACELGDEEGCVLLGDYVDRWGIAHPRVQSAEQELLSTCKGGEQRACIGAGHLLVRHEPRSEAYGQALTLFSAACAEGLPSACIAGAQQRRIGQARKIEAPTQVEMWTRACDQHSPKGCAGLGERLSRSKSTWDAAYTAWTKACDTGDAHSCTELGLLVEEKHEPWPAEQDQDAYLTRGCENGDAEGCFHLAEDEVPKKGDPPEPAYLLLQRSCEGDYGDACAELARIHLDRDTSFDEEIAARNFEAACESGHYESCKELGGMYMRGKGVEKDRQKARELVQRYSINARRRHVRLGLHGGFPYVAGGELELVAPIPVGPALSVTGSYSYLPGLGSPLVMLVGESNPEVAPDLQYIDAGARLYPNNKARGIYGMVGIHRLSAIGGELTAPLVRDGLSARLGMYSENGILFTRIEIGMAQYGLVHLSDFDEDESGSFPLIQPTIGASVGLALF